MSEALLIVISLTISGSALAFAVLCLKPLTRNKLPKTFQYYMWLVVLMRLALPLSLPGNLVNTLLVKANERTASAPVWSWMSSRDYPPAGTPIHDAPGQGMSPDQTGSIPRTQEPVSPGAAMPQGDLTETTSPATDGDGAERAAETEPHATALWNWIGANLTNVWLAGSILHFGWFAVAYFRFAHILNKTFAEPEPRDLALFDSLRGGAGARLACCRFVDTPMLIGLFSPSIVIPQRSFVEEGMEKELRHVLLHELTHYRRRDLVYKWFAVIVTSLHWFNPLMILIRREINRACELSCDEAVVSAWDSSERNDYGETLLKLSTDRKAPAGIITTTMCEEKRDLKERLVSIMRYTKNTPMMIAISALLCVLIAGCGAVFGAVDVKELGQSEPGLEPFSKPVSQGEDWFVGDWAGLWQLGSEAQPPSEADFGATLYGIGDPNICLLRAYKTESGYAATLGYTEWEITEHDDAGFSMKCVKVGERAGARPESILSRFRPDFEVGDSAAFTYRERVESTVPSMQVPEGQILRGTTRRGADEAPDMVFLLAYLPPGSERSEKDNVYPCWYGGYEDMESDFKGMFLLCGNARRRFFGVVTEDAAGREWVFTDEDGANRDMTFGPRDGTSSDLLQMVPVEDVPDAWWPRFSRFDQADPSRTWSDATSQHVAYFRDVYIPRLRDEVEALQTDSQPDTHSWEDILARLGLVRPKETAAPNASIQRRILVRQGLIHYASLVVDGALSEKLVPCVPDMLTLDAAYLPTISLAGIYPGDTLAGANKLYSSTLQPIAEREAQELGFHGVYDSAGTMHYTDGKGLVLDVLADGRVGVVSVYKAGYDTPDGRQVGDDLDPSTRILHGKDGVVVFDESRIVLKIVLDRVWSETRLDIDGDGEIERLTLSGRSYMGSFLECGTRLGDYEKGTVDPEDYATSKAALRVYKGDTLADEAQLPLYLYYLTPRFSGIMQENVPGKVWIACDTGGTGEEIPVYVVTREEDGEDGWRTEYLGLHSVRE